MLDSELKKIIKASQDRFELWSSLAGYFQCKDVAEIGVWRGEFAEGLLRGCPFISSYLMIDPWRHLPEWNKPYNVDDEVFDDVYQEAMSRTKFAADKLTIIRAPTILAAEEIPDESLDLVYVDGDHTLRGITIDLLRLISKVRPGGFLAGDDFCSSPWQHGLAYEPTLVCPFAIYFAEAMGLPIIALPYNQFLIINTPQKGYSFTDLSEGLFKGVSLNEPPSLRDVLVSKIKALYQ